jgi:hypothetical protein
MFRKQPLLTHYVDHAVAAELDLPCTLFRALVLNLLRYFPIHETAFARTIYI